MHVLSATSRLRSPPQRHTFCTDGAAAPPAAPKDRLDLIDPPSAVRGLKTIASLSKRLVERRFLATLCRLGVPTKFHMASVQLVERHYSEAHRHYHTLTHLAAMCAALETNRLKPVELSVVILAILFHDIVYDPRRQDNEDASMTVFRVWAQNLGLNAQLIKSVMHLIDRTKQHDVADPQHPDLALFLDLDLEVLSRSPQGYARYTQEVRREYAHVPNPLFVYHRAKVLRKLLGQPTLYATDTFRRAHETQARQNLAAEIAQLDKQAQSIYARGCITLWRCKKYAVGWAHQKKTHAPKPAAANDP